MSLGRVGYNSKEQNPCTSHMTYVLEDWVGTNGLGTLGLRWSECSNPNSVFLREVRAIPRDPPAGWENPPVADRRKCWEKKREIYN